MKKILVGTLGVFLFFSCNEKKEDSPLVNTESIEMVEEQQGDSNLDIQASVPVVPVFENEEASILANKYNTYVIDLKSAAGESQEKLSELTAKAVELEKEYQKVAENLNEEDKQKLSVFIEALKQSVQ